jgi:hypothetical protein
MHYESIDSRLNPFESPKEAAIAKRFSLSANRPQLTLR